MKSTKAQLICVFIIIVSMLGCSQKSVPQYDMSAAKISIKKNKKFEVMLKANPATGFRWELAKPTDKSMIEFVNREYKAGAPDKSMRMGAGGHEFWTFKTLKKGETTLEFKYVRSGSKDEPDKLKKFLVEIK